MSIYYNKSGLNESRKLTEREIAVLIGLGKALSNKEIAKQLFVTHHTIKAHISGIYKKLGITNRVEAAMIARDMGLV